MRSKVKGVAVFAVFWLLWQSNFGIAFAERARPPSESFGEYVGGYDAKRKSVIVFVHGVLGDDRDTLTNENGTYWPALVRQDPTFADANIYVHRYKTPKLDTAHDIEELAIRFGDFLDADGVLKHEKLYFISHSMGGLVTRAFLVHKRLPPARVPMLFFYGTPSAGADLAAVGAAASKNRQFENMRPFGPGTYVEELAVKWLSTAGDPRTSYPVKIWSFCAYEKKPYYGRIIVPEVSALYLCNTTPRAIADDHINMVKPASARADAHMYLGAAYRFSTNPSSQMVLAALSSTNQATFVGHFLEYKNEAPQLRFRTKLATETISVGCAEELKGTKTLRPQIKGNEFVVAAFAHAEKSENLGTWSVAAAPTDTGKIVFSYDVKASTANTTCDQKGFGNFVIKYLVAEPE